MDPTALMLAPRCVVVARIKIGGQDPTKVVAQQAIDHRTGTTAPESKRALARRGGQRPDVALVPLFAPSGFIGVDRRTRLDGRVDLRGLRLALLGDPSQEITDRPQTHREAMYQLQPGLDQPNGGAQHQAHLGDQSCQPHPKASLSDHLARQVQPRFLPTVTVGAPATLHLMLRHLHGRRWRHLDHLTAAAHMQATQASLTPRTLRDRVMYHRRRCFALPSLVVFGRTLLAHCFGACGHVGLHERRRRRLRVLQLGNPLLRCRQLRRQVRDLLLHSAQLALDCLPVIRAHGDHRA